MIQVINRALDILEIVAANPEKPTALGEIADALGLNHGTCANIMKTLVTRNYLEQVGTKKGYILGAKSYALTNNDAYRKAHRNHQRELSAGHFERRKTNCYSQYERRAGIAGTNLFRKTRVRLRLGQNAPCYASRA